MEHVKEYTDSKVVKSLKYNDETKELEIEYLTGRKYKYFDFPQQLWDDAMNAPSIGSFIHKVKGHYRYERLE